MAGRIGRRGRGKPIISISSEQSDLSKEEAAPVLQPSPSYPTLNRKAPPMELTPEMSYLVALKLHFAEYMQASPNYVQADKVNEDIERYSDNYEKSMPEHKKFEFALIREHDWSMFPTELRPSSKRKVQRQRRKRKNIDMEKKFMELEKKEEMHQIKTKEGKEEEDKEGEEEKDTEGEEIGDGLKEEEEVDEEMDDGTDYAKEYFETGENYFSEDDNDDGPIF